MGARVSLFFRAFMALSGALPNMSIGVLLAAAPSAALASPDCSKAGSKPSAACVVKLEYCTHTSIVLVLAVRNHEDGMKEAENLSKLMGGTTHETWYTTYSEIVKSIVHQLYTDDPTYQKLRARIDPSMAFAVSALTAGCNANKSVSVDTR